MKKILVLGPGCAKCSMTEKIVREAVASSGTAAEVTKVSDIMEMMRLGVMSTPAVIVDDKLMCSGRVPSVEEVQGWLAGEEVSSSAECGCSCSCGCR